MDQYGAVLVLCANIEIRASKSQVKIRKYAFFVGFMIIPV